jgi:hypothetical protein
MWALFSFYRATSGQFIVVPRTERQWWVYHKVFRLGDLSWMSSSSLPNTRIVITSFAVLLYPHRRNPCREITVLLGRSCRRRGRSLSPLNRLRTLDSLLDWSRRSRRLRNRLALIQVSLRSYLGRILIAGHTLLLTGVILF